MKKMLIALLAVAGLASCTKSDVEFESNQQQIGLSPITQNRTRAMVSDSAFPATEKFMVWAWYKQLPAGTTISTWQADATAQQTYIDEKEFEPKATTQNATGLWAGVTPYFWPKLGSLLFAGYYPATAELAGIVSYQFDKDNNVMTIAGYKPTTDDYATTGFVTTNTTHEEDLMYFKMTPASSDSATNDTGNTVNNESNVDVVFQHALAWIKVTLAEAENTPADATITVSSVKFTDVCTTGTGTVEDLADIVWATTADVADIEVLDAATVLDVATTVEKQPIVIPQAMSGNIVITYTIASKDGSEFEEVKTIALNTLKDDAATPNTINKWEAGKCYTYAISIGTSEILIDPAVTDWGEVNIPIDVK